MTSADMRDFGRGYEHAIEVVRAHPKQAMSEGMVNRILRSTALNDGPRPTSKWFKEGATMALEACERAYLTYGPYEPREAGLW